MKTKAELEKELRRLKRLIRKAKREHSRLTNGPEGLSQVWLTLAWQDVYDAALKEERGRK